MTTGATYGLIVRAIHERGEKQAAALAEMDRRGLWLSADQRRQAGLPLTEYQTRRLAQGLDA